MRQERTGPLGTAVRRAAHTAADLAPGVGHRALLFDWDGTLADSQAVNFAALARALWSQHTDLDRAWFDARTGVSTREMVQQVGALYGRQLDVDRAVGERDRNYFERIAEVSEVADVVEILRREHGHRACALATGGGRATVLPTAERLGLVELFDAVITREDVELGKPAPDIFLLAADRLGVPPEQCLVYEDSDEGLEAAAAAGMDVIDVRPLRGTA